MDSPLSIIASIASILTFLYAILAGVYLIFQTASHTEDELAQMLHSLAESQGEVSNAMTMAEASAKLAEDDRSQALVAVVDHDAKDSAERLEAITTLVNQMMRIETGAALQDHQRLIATIKATVRLLTMPSSLSARLGYRRRFVMMQKDVQKELLAKDIAMERLRGAKDRYDEHVTRQQSLRIEECLKDIVRRLETVESSQKALQKTYGTGIEPTDNHVVASEREPDAVPAAESAD